MQLYIDLPGLKYLLTMRLCILLTVVLCLHVSATGYGQKVTLSVKNIPLEKVIKEVTKQTGYSFVYTREQLKGSLPVTCNVVQASLSQVLSICFSNQPLKFVIEGNYVVVQTKISTSVDIQQADSVISVNGHVINDRGEPLAGATVIAKNSNRGVSTNKNGDFMLTDVDESDVLVISSVGYFREEIPINQQRYFLINLRFAVNSLEETVVKGYYSTSRKLNTGSVSKVNSDEINQQPVSNPISALQGRVPGLLITQKNGLPGSNMSIQIRGQNSIQQGNDPLFIVDGVPFSSGNLVKSGLSLNVSSPFNTLNPSDIESIEILKDADATAIYGSRGANGVVLITTKKPRPGKMSVSAGVLKGWGRTTRTMDYMDTRQYLAMRNEAFKNDGVTPNVTNAPDLTLWDTVRSTDWKQEITGNIVGITNIRAGLAGGTKKTDYSFNTGYYREGTALPGNNKYTRGSVSLNVANTSEDNKFQAVLSSSYTFDDNNLPSQDLTSYVNLPPNMYRPYDSLGKLLWSDAGFSYGNPFSILRQQYNATSERLMANFSLSYKLFPKIVIRSNFSYNMVQYDQYSTRPISSQDPAYNPKGSADFNNTKSRTWNIEPQLDYNTNLFSKGLLQLLVGTTWQQKKDNGIYLTGSGYTNDAQIASIAGASAVTVQNDYALYRFASVYGRLNYNWAGKYLVNIVARQDASSRFGTGNRLGAFAAVGAAWIFSGEKFMKDNFPVLSFGKLRASFGTTGNDRIGDYQYLDSWGNTTNAYQGQTGLRPLRLFNESYSWEEIRKADAGIDLSFLKDRISVTADLFRHRSTNQLISYSLPDQTGFTSVIRNIPAVVQNKGIEISLTTVNLKNKSFSWISSFNLTVQRNKLIEFSGLASSNYVGRYIPGKPINLLIGYTYLGVDPLTGIYQFGDTNKDGLLNSQDYTYQGSTDPDFFGGFNNTVQYKNIGLSFLFEFRKQLGRHAIFGYSGLPGTIGNQPLAVLDRWQNPGDVATYQRFTQSYGTAASDAASRTPNSGAALTDASFIRLKTLALSYSLPEKFLKGIKAGSCKFYLQGQNLFTITRYTGADPENQNLQVLPPLGVFTVGINVNF